MLTKILRHAILLLALAPLGVAQSADSAIDCRLKGGSVVQLPAGVCTMEGGAPVNEASTPVSGALPEHGDQPPSGEGASHSGLDVTRKLIVDLLAKPVETTTPLNRNPEGLARTARFDGCRLMVEEELHIQYGNAFSVWKDFKINSVIDLQNIDREKFGLWDSVTSLGGELSAAAVYIEERKSKGGNNISISVLEPRDGGYAKYTVHGLSAYWGTPRDDLWITDGYGYAKDTGWNTAATDKIRLLFIVKTPDDAARLKNALQEVAATCQPQQVETESKGPSPE